MRWLRPTPHAPAGSPALALAPGHSSRILPSLSTHRPSCWTSIPYLPAFPPPSCRAGSDVGPPAGTLCPTLPPQLHLGRAAHSVPGLPSSQCLCQPSWDPQVLQQLRWALSVPAPSLAPGPWGDMGRWIKAATEMLIPFANPHRVACAHQSPWGPRLRTSSGPNHL